MIGQLPKSLVIGGKEYGINADFRNILEIFKAFGDERLTDGEKAYICVKRLYSKEIPVKFFEEAVGRAYWFCDGGDMPKTEPEKIKMLNWEHDEAIIMPAVSRTAGVIDVRELPFLHWWTFLGIFGEIGDGLFSAVMNIRRKKLSGKKLDKWENEFFNKNREMIILHTAKEQAAIDETEEFLKTII